ncbi:MAG: V-type ATP synthase subunit K [Spirochaetales bacterium]|nr:V-type ATP synthase subunit K [Spirochaetales bacterium]
MDIGFIGIAAAFAISAFGSAMGIGIAGQGAVGAWKRCYAQNKNAPMTLIIFVSAPITQTFYGYILMNAIRDADADPMAKLAVGLFGGLAIAASATFQGKVGAAASDAQGETGKGTSNYIAALGVVESVAIFVMALMLLTISTLK